MEDDNDKNYNLIISELEKDFGTEIKLIDKLYLKHKDKFQGGYLTQTIKDELNYERRDFLTKWSWKVPVSIYNSEIHRKKYLKKSTELCIKVYEYPFEIIKL